jgi:hypothetical protein
LDRRHPQPRHFLRPGLAAALLGAGLLALVGCGRRIDDPDSQPNARAAPAGRAGSAGGTSAVPLAPQDADSPEVRLCRQFMDLKNAGDPQADRLLAPAPAVPETAVAPAEADRLDAEVMLRQPFHVQEVGRDAAAPGAAGRFVLVVNGSVAAGRVVVRTPTGEETRQRAMWSPDLVVDVREGKIHGVRPQLHEE